MRANKTWLAMAGVTAGLLATAAHGTAPAKAQAVPICGSWTDFTVADSGQTYTLRLPTVARNDRNPNCTFQQGTATDGVYKLQDALNFCYAASIPRDGMIGPEDVYAIIGVQQRHGLPWDGNLYPARLRNIMLWPLYRSDYSFSHCWHL